MKTIILLTTTGMLISLMLSCKKGCTDEQATNYNSKAKKDDGSCTYSNAHEVTLDDEILFFEMDFDGMEQDEKVGYDDYEMYSSSYKNYSGGESHAVMFTSIFSNLNQKQRSFNITKGILVYPGNWTAPETDYEAFFAPGVYEYDENGSEEGIVISFTDANGVDYITNVGAQPGSSKFEIMDSREEFDGSTQRMKVLCEFTCKIYEVDNPSVSHTITNGVFLGYFDNF